MFLTLYSLRAHERLSDIIPAHDSSVLSKGVEIVMITNIRVFRGHALGRPL